MVFDSEDVVLSGHRKGVADRDLVSRSLGLYRWGRDPEEGDRRVWRYPRKWGLRSSAVKVNKVPPIGPGKAEMADGARHILSGGSAEENNTRTPEQPTVAA